MQAHHPILAGTVEAHDGGNVYVYADGVLARDPETGEFVVLAGHHTVVEVVDRMHRVAALELLDVEAIALAVLLLTQPTDTDTEEES